MNFDSFKVLIERFGVVSGLVVAGPILAFLAAAGGLAPFWVPSIGFIGALVMVVAIILVFRVPLVEEPLRLQSDTGFSLRLAR